MSSAVLTATIDSNATEDDLVHVAQEAVSRCNWLIGECASRWTERYAKGRTDADFGELVGLSGDQIFQRRRVWETFSDVRDDYSELKWSHFYACVTWDDSMECLGWAQDMGATVAEMKAWRRASRGEDLTVQGEDDGVPFDANISPLEPVSTSIRGGEFAESDGSSSSSSKSRESDPEMASAARATDNDDYAPFGKGARGSAPSETAPETDEPVRPLAVFKKVASTLERLDKQLSPAVLAAADEVPDDIRQRVLDAFERVSGKVAEL